jgi:tetratricopeptide (TPR) repeat protein
MASFYDFKQAISKLNKEKKYNDALKYFKEHKTSFTDEEIGNDEYLIDSMLSALRHTNNFDSAFKFLQHYKIIISEFTKERVLQAYGWLLYSKFKSENLQADNNHHETEIFEEDEIPDGSNNFHFNKTEIIERIEELFPLLLKFENEFAYSVFSNLFSSVLKAEKKKPSPNWNFVLEFCNLVTPEQLKTECRTIEVIRKNEKKPMELASDKENWYAYKSKALMKLGKYQECYDVSNIALETFDVFHYSNDVWFARRIALSKKNLGNSEDAITELQKILRKKKEWFIQKELAELYKDSGNNENAFKYAIEAINNFGDLEYKVDLLFLIGELLKIKKEDDLAFKHFSLSRLIRISEEWNTPSKLTSAIEQFGRDYIPIEKIKELKIELKSYWNTFKQPQSNPKPQVNIVNQKANDLVGKTFNGTVKNTVDFGVFFKLDGAPDGLLHKNSLPNNLKNNFKDEFPNGKKMSVKIDKVTDRGIQLVLAN